MTNLGSRIAQEFGWPKAASGVSNQPWSGEFQQRLCRGFERFTHHGRFEEWNRLLGELPRIDSPKIKLDTSAPACSWEGNEGDETLTHTLAALGPWKKGPFRIQDIHIDAEWQSNFKWDRLLKMAQPFAGRRVLDVGTGNGYFLYRAKGAGAKLVVGLEPSAHFCAQYLALQHCYQVPDIAMLPLTSDEFKQECQAFDTVLSMGVLYHRRSPLDHLAELKGFLRSRGQLLLETIIVEGDEGYSLVPEARYAQMRNVWFLPSVRTLISWVKRMGFVEVSCSESVTTTPEEQRSTSWTSQPSLKDFLNPENPALTREGYPAPKRVILSAFAP